MTTQTLPKESIEEITDLLPLIPYKDEREFVIRAIEDKILEYKSMLFFEGTEKIRKSLIHKKIKPEDLVKKFDHQIHQR